MLPHSAVHHTWILNFSYFFLSLCHHCSPLRDGNGFFLLWKFLSWEWIFPFTWKIYCFKIPLWRVVFLKIQQSLLFVLFVSFHENSESSVDDFSSLYFASSLRCHLSPVSPWQTWLILMLLQLLEICVLKMQIAFCKDFLFFFDVHSISTLLQ